MIAGYDNGNELLS